jgi:hypothetical protein
MGRLKRLTFTPTLTAGGYSANDVLFETTLVRGGLPGAIAILRNVTWAAWSHSDFAQCYRTR